MPWANNLNCRPSSRKLKVPRVQVLHLLKWFTLSNTNTNTNTNKHTHTHPHTHTHTHTHPNAEAHEHAHTTTHSTSIHAPDLVSLPASLSLWACASILDTAALLRACQPFERQIIIGSLPAPNGLNAMASLPALWHMRPEPRVCEIFGAQARRECQAECQIELHIVCQIE